MRSLTPFILTVFGCLAISAAERTNQVTITTRPRFDDQVQFTYLLLADDKHSYRFRWSMSPGIQYVPVTLKTNRVYTFTVTEEPWRSIIIPKLIKVRQGDQIIYDIEVCEVHKTRMEEKQVPVAYGFILPGPEAPPDDTERQSFPHRREYSLGGCVISDDSPKTEGVYVCTDCKKAYEKWKTDNKKAK